MNKTTQNESIESVLNTLIQGMKKEDLNSTKCSLKDLTSKKNAYTKTHAQIEEEQRWNMITYKKGRKSSL